ncbi:hypothetical protein Sulku_1721 [Sulfuricurvum kujiense DSM 16994]|uniref:HNH endonuclease n=1 Tax=Sulfuricurvum kujiense (strain ATCC BAA-921 / DSM 16994 / JCM 11577 / YK-1) TaxID=709032 RepID=E4U0Y0_SULKY|nr:hypothetical protein [Sulfuricurvum kujiense]ADR34382.1 hypothetical protein Sulku_1721 [Sulfuricurvum kujiense DSM 16994]
MTDLEKKYFDTVFIERICTYAQIAEKIEISAEKLKEMYAKNGGIDKCIADQIFNIDIIEYLNLKDSMSTDKVTIDEIYQKYSNKKSSANEGEFQFHDWKEFYGWYIEQIKNGETCCYCGVNQSKIKISLDGVNNLSTPYVRLKRKTRGVSLEIERVDTSDGHNLYSVENCRLACHVCNNAKSDFITAQEFEPIARGIYNFWKEKVGVQDIIFPTEVYKTFK